MGVTGAVFRHTMHDVQPGYWFGLIWHPLVVMVCAWLSAIEANGLVLHSVTPVLMALTSNQ